MHIRAVVAVVVLAIAGASSCRDLAFEEPGGQNTPPRVEFVSPEDGDALPLRWRVSLEIEDADGVATASLNCGTPLFEWTHAPFEAEVDLSPCAATADGGVATVTLNATASDTLGAQSTPASVSVTVDAALPQITAAIPARVAPGANVTFTVFAASELSATPSVTVEGALAQVSPKSTMNAFDVSFVAPRIDAPVGATIEELQVSERPVTVEISATGVNGNTVRLLRTIIVSRVLWERPVPGLLWTTFALSHDSTPRGVAQGLWVALENDPGGDGLSWSPGFFHAADGTFERPPIAPMSIGRGFGSDGTALVARGTSVESVWPDGGVNATGKLGTSGLFRFPDRTCTMEFTPVGMCDGTGTFSCVPAGAALPSIPFGPNLNGGPPRAVISAGSVQLGLNLQNPCFIESDTVIALSAAGTATTPQLGVIGASGVFFDRVVPYGQSGGAFVLANALPREVKNGGVIVSSQPAIASADIIAGMDDGALVSISATSASTVLSRIVGKTVTPVTTLPGRYDFLLDPALGGITSNLVRTADGGFVYLARTHNSGRAVIALDASLKPKWIYPYPRGTTRAVLVGDVPSSQIYLVDLSSNYVVALARAD